MVDAFSGMLGGPLADLAELIGTQLSVIRAPIAHEVAEGRGSLTIGDGTVVAEMEPYRGPDGSITTLQNSIFSTLPGSPAGSERPRASPSTCRSTAGPTTSPGATRSSRTGRSTTGVRPLERCGPRAARGSQGSPPPVLAAIAVAWVAAVAAEVTGVAGSVHHDSLLESGPAFGPALLLLPLAWQVMTAAMMLPSSLPLVGP